MPEVPSGVENKEPAESDKLRQHLGNMFDGHKKGEDRIQEIVTKSALDKYEGLLDVDTIKQQLDECALIEDREVFIERVAVIVQPLVDFAKTNPKEREGVLREVHHEMIDAVQLSEVLSYDRGEDWAGIHLAPAHELGIAETKKSVIEGLKNLANIISKDPDIKNVVASSWILGKNPKLIERLGFGKVREVSEEEKAQRDIHEERPMGEATMSREDFLNRYLK